MKKNYDWLVNKTPRSVDQLRLWSDNPRLNPEEKHIKLHHFVEDFTLDFDRGHFIKLIRSIATGGFIPADPIIVWKNEDNQKYYVAEGNRRVAALKLLRDPDKSPKNIRSIVRQCASKINKTDIDKIQVNVAPSFADAEWYINQRNSALSLQRPWSREQQQRWIIDLYEKYDGNISIIQNKTNFTKSELEGTIRLLKIKDFIKLPDVNSQLTNEEFEWASSYHFPMTILERFLSISEARKQWGIVYNGTDVNIISNKQSFYNAFAELVKQIMSRKINTRFTKDDLPNILSNLPHVSFNNETDVEPSMDNDKNLDDKESEKVNISVQKPKNNNIRGNRNRRHLIPFNCELNTTNNKLKMLFGELRLLAFTRQHSISVVLRVFFDLAVLEYIESEDLEKDIIDTNKQVNELKHVTLKKRLEYIKCNQKLNQEILQVIGRLLNPQNSHYSLDTLNGYVHSKDTHYSDKVFLNGFWDFLYPLFKMLLDIKEIKQ